MQFVVSAIASGRSGSRHGVTVLAIGGGGTVLSVLLWLRAGWLAAFATYALTIVLIRIFVLHFMQIGRDAGTPPG